MACNLLNRYLSPIRPRDPMPAFKRRHVQVALAAALLASTAGGAATAQSSLDGAGLAGASVGGPAAAELLGQRAAAAPAQPQARAEPATRPPPPPNPLFAADGELRPFGANLFTGGFSGDGENGLNPGYAVQPGDRISVRIWGATDFNQSLVVDRQGNIFIPTVGPVMLRGTRNSDLDQRVARAVGTVYTDNVHVYASLDGSQPVAVLVTGYVPRPGRFGGIPSNSLLHFLDRAGGVDPERGSYRDVRVLRDGETIARVDLYDFLLDGSIASLQFRDGDTIVVGERGAAVAVSGAIGNQALFELDGERATGEEIARMAMLEAGVSHVGVSGIADGAPYSRYLPLDAFATSSVRDGDEINFRIDRRDTVIVVDVEGSHLGPSRYAVPRDTRLQDLLDYIEVDAELADVGAVSLRREAIALRQEAALRESLARLEARYLTASSQTDQESSIRSREAELISRFVESAREVRPSGRLVVARGGEVANVLLQSGDTVTIPARSDSVLLSGEVLVSQAMLHEPGLRARDYIERSGGFNEQADRGRIVVVHADGDVASGDNPRVRAGDEIIVMPKVPVKNLQLAATIVDIVYKIAVAASVAISL